MKEEDNGKGKELKELVEREGKFVMCCRMSVSAQASTVFSRIGQPYGTTHAFSQDKASLDDPIISFRPCRDRLSHLPETTSLARRNRHQSLQYNIPAYLRDPFPTFSNSRLLACPVNEALPPSIRVARIMLFLVSSSCF